MKTIIRLHSANTTVAMIPFIMYVN